MKQSLINWLATADLLNKAAVAKAVSENSNINLSPQMLNDVVKGLKPLPDAHVWPLCIVLSRYRLVIDEWKFEYDESDDTFILEKDLGYEPEVIERESETGGTWFEYKVSVNRHLIDSPHELLSFFPD